MWLRRIALRVADKDADYAVVIDADVPEEMRASVGAKRLFIGAKDMWEAPLAKWLEPFKGNVF